MEPLERSQTQNPFENYCSLWTLSQKRWWITMGVERKTQELNSLVNMGVIGKLPLTVTDRKSDVAE